jgi:kynurenine formamidase
MSLPLDPERVRAYDLGQPLERTTPTSPNHPGFEIALIRRHGDVMREDGSSGANDLMSLGTHTGTHIDALCHIAAGGRIHGGHNAEAVSRGGRFTSLGAETIAPIIARGVLIDVAALMDLDVLDPGQEVGAAELDAACERSGVAVGGGDIVLIRTGWARNFDSPEDFVGRDTGVPGISESGAAWLAERGIRAAGSDTISFEKVGVGGSRLLPVHTLLLVDHGIHIMEVLNLEELARDGATEFLFVAAPLKIVGATGAPMRPLALVS